MVRARARRVPRRGRAVLGRCGCTDAGRVPRVARLAALLARDTGRRALLGRALGAAERCDLDRRGLSARACHASA